MTGDVMNLRALVEKSAEADLLRQMIGFAAGRLMEMEVCAATGAAYGEKWRLRPMNHHRFHEESGGFCEVRGHERRCVSSDSGN